MNIGFFYQSSVYALIQKGWDCSVIKGFCGPRDIDKIIMFTNIKNEAESIPTIHGLSFHYIESSKFESTEFNFLDVLIICGERKNFQSIRNCNPSLKLYFMTKNNNFNSSWFNNSLDGILCISDLHMDMLKDITKIPVIRCYKLIHTKSYIEDISYIRRNSKVLRCMIVAKPHSGKNHLMALEAIKLLSNKFSIELDLYGITQSCGHNQIHNKIVQQILYKIKDMPYVSLKDRFAHKDMINEYRKHDCSILASSSEGLCYSALDSLLAGTPLLCTKIRPFTDYCRENRNTLFFDLTIKSIKSCIQNFYNQKESIIKSAEYDRCYYYNYTTEYSKNMWEIFWNNLENMKNTINKPI